MIKFTMIQLDGRQAWLKYNSGWAKHVVHILSSIPAKTFCMMVSYFSIDWYVFKIKFYSIKIVSKL